MAVIDAPGTDSATAAAVAAAVSPGRGAVWLDTPHWLLTAVTPAHAPLFARLHARNGDHFRLAMTIEPGMTEPGFWEPVLRQQERAFLDGTGLFLVGFHKQAPRPEIGCVISFSGIVHEDLQCCWLGYRLDQALEGRGLMREALDAAIASVFSRYRLHRMMASHQPENLRSAQLLRRVSFGIDGYARDFMLVNGKWRDNVLLSRLAPGC